MMIQKKLPFMNILGPLTQAIVSCPFKSYGKSDFKALKHFIMFIAITGTFTKGQDCLTACAELSPQPLYCAL
jgi:hypothetical protein